MSVFSLNRLSHLLGKTGFQDVLLFQLRSVSTFEVAEVVQVGAEREQERGGWGVGEIYYVIYQAEKVEGGDRMMKSTIREGGSVVITRGETGRSASTVNEVRRARNRPRPEVRHVLVSVDSVKCVLSFD